MSRPIAKLAAVSQALVPPEGDADAFPALGLPRPDPEDLAQEHGALFGRTGPARVSPYVCRSGGAELHAIVSVYADAGFELDPGFHDRADHVCAQFAFLAALDLDERQAQEEGCDDVAAQAEARRRSFVAGRFGRFVPSFLAGLDAEVGFPVHRTLARRATEILAAAGIDARVSVRPRPRDSRAGLICEKCGDRLAVPALPASAPRPAWGDICVRCRMRPDLERTAR